MAKGGPLDADAERAGLCARGQFHGVRAPESAARARVPDRGVAQHGRAQISVVGQDRVETLLVVADQPGPAVEATVEVVVEKNALARIKPAQRRIAQQHGLTKINSHNFTPQSNSKNPPFTISYSFNTR